jgi:hypothetical protein
VDGAESVVRKELTVADQAPPPVELVPERRATIEVNVHGADGHAMDSGAVTVSFVPSSPRLRYERSFKVSTYSVGPGSYWRCMHA